MKKVILIFTILLSSNQSFSQQSLINEILGVKYTYKDFNLKSNVKQMTVGKGYKIEMGIITNQYKHFTFNSSGFLSRETTTKLKTSNIIENEKTFAYDKHNRLERINVFEKSELVEQYFFTFNNTNQLVKIINQKSNSLTKTIYDFSWDNNVITKYLLTNENGTIEYETFKHVYDKDNNLITYDFNEDGDFGNVINSYYKSGLLKSEAYTYTNDASYNFKIDYTYNNANDKLTQTEDGITVNYDYITYDSKNNWTKMKNKEYSLFYVTNRTFTYFK